MDRLWAPWRSSYVTAPQTGGCLFCGLASGDGDGDGLVLARRPLVIVVLNRYPYTNGHLMVAPVRHAAMFSLLSEDERSALLGAVSVAERAFTEGFRAEGMNGGWNVGRCAGAGVEGHLHVHVLPRWPGDVNFMPAVAGARVISESLESSRDRLRPFFGDMP
jgi:ATP adenylyltransferase